MSGATEHFTVFGKDVIMSKREINENTYIVLVYPNASKQQVIVYADPDGTDHGFPDHPATINAYDEIHRDTQPQYRGVAIETFTSHVLNKAVCDLEGKQEQRGTWERKVDAALEANKEIHEGIEYHLDDSTDTRE